MFILSLRLVAVLALICFSFGFFAVDAQAQGGDKEIATKEGVSESLGTKEFDQDKLPGKLEMGIAFGSCVAVIAVIKYL